MSSTVFFRLLLSEDKAAALTEAVDALRDSDRSSLVYEVDTGSFRQVPGLPFAYWVSEYIRQIFTKMQPLESEGREAQRGVATTDDFRFLRAWWEVQPELAARDRAATLQNRRWVPFAKGGAYSPYYQDWELVIDWGQDGKVLKDVISEYRGSRGWGYQWSGAINGHSYYFQPGLTWSLRTQAGLSLRVLPSGCIFGHKGPSVFASEESLPMLLAITNSLSFANLVSVQMAFGSYEVGVIERTPIPPVPSLEGESLGNLAVLCYQLKRDLDTANETSHIFHVPALLQVQGSTLAVRQVMWQARLAQVGDQLAAHQGSIDDMAFRLYGIVGEDRRAIEGSVGGAVAEPEADASDPAEETEEAAPPADIRALAHDLLSYAVGCAFGRWDVRYATGARPAPILPHPFGPLPICSPGMLTGADGLPLPATTPDYSLTLDPDGILVDDPDHPDDIVRRARAVLAIIWGADADAIEQELAAALDVKDLRDYFRRGFFDTHLRRYSKSRRKAPIYWLLQSPRRLYGMWVYYHRLDHDTLFKALSLYVERKLVLETARLDELRAALQAAGPAGKAAKSAATALDRQEQLLADMQEFRDRLARAAHLNLTPDLNDGVLLTIAPLHALVPWKEARAAWDALLAGKYAWSSIGQQLREKGLVKRDS